MDKNEIISKKIKVLKSLIIFYIFWNSTYFQLIPIQLFNITKETINNVPELTVLISTFSSSIVALIFLIAYKKDLIEEFKKFKKNFLKNMDLGFKCWFIGFIIMIVCNFILAFILNSGGAKNENLVQELIKILPIIMAFEISILAPFTEEIAFRKTLKDIIKNKWLFVLLSFLLFGGAHVITNAKSIIDWLYIIPYGALGGAFAYAYYETDTIFTSMTLHLLHNTAVFIISIIAL